MRHLWLFFKVVSTKILAHVCDFIPPERHLRDIQIHLTPSLGELSILKTHFLLVLLVNGKS